MLDFFTYLVLYSKDHAYMIFFVEEGGNSLFYPDNGSLWALLFSMLNFCILLIIYSAELRSGCFRA